MRLAPHSLSLGVSTQVSSDPWLQPWMPLILERAGTGPVLEIGCGTGQDTLTLADAGARVVAFDQSPQAVAKARERAPQAEITCQDARDPFPSLGLRIGVVIASLSLHYFSWSETRSLFARVHDQLCHGGLFLCRLNSTNDHNHGASGHPQIEPNYYLVDGLPKRFFDRASIDQLFAHGWRILSMQELATDKYARPKVLWELVVERDA